MSYPSWIYGYYDRHWREMKDSQPERFRRDQRPVLCFLATSREPVNLLQISEWSGLDLGDVKDVVAEWREFLNEDRDTQFPVYRLYHRSFADFLDEQENLRWYHDRIAQRALDKIIGLQP